MSVRDLIIDKDVKNMRMFFFACECAFSHTGVQNMITSDENNCPPLKSGKHQIES